MFQYRRTVTILLFIVSVSKGIVCYASSDCCPLTKLRWYFCIFRFRLWAQVSPISQMVVRTDRIKLAECNSEHKVKATIWFNLFSSFQHRIYTIHGGVWEWWVARISWGVWCSGNSAPIRSNLRTRTVHRGHLTQPVTFSFRNVLSSNMADYC